MSRGRYLWRNLCRHPVRNILTALAATVAIFLFVFLRSIITSLDKQVKETSADRLVVQSAVSLFVNLPESYESKIAQVPGVESVSRWIWFGGTYVDPENFFAKFAVDAEKFLGQYPELVISEGEKRSFLGDRKGCLVGARLAEKFGFEVGRDIPIEGTIYWQEAAWDFTVQGIYTSTKAILDENTMWFHYEYLRQAREAGAMQGPDGVGIYVVKVAPDADEGAVAQGIDALFAAGPQRTRTETEAAFQAGFVAMLGNVPMFLTMIGAPVLIAVFFGVVNTMLISSRERYRDVGILKALGFPASMPGRLVLLEGMLITGIGGLLGIVLAVITQEPFRKQFGMNLSTYVVEPQTVIIGVLIALLIGGTSGLVPAWRARRLAIVDALRAEV